MKIFHRPLLQKLLFISFNALEEAVMPFYAIQKREIGHECFLLNAYNLASMLAPEQGDIPSLAHRLPPHTIVLNLWGGQFFPQERIAYEEKALGEIAAQFNLMAGEKLDGIPEANLRLQKMLNRPWEGEVYWKERMSGGCLEVVMEAALDKVPAYWRLFRQLAGEHGIDTTTLGLYIQPRQRARVCHVEFHIPCDPHSAKRTAAPSRPSPVTLHRTNCHTEGQSTLLRTSTIAAHFSSIVMLIISSPGGRSPAWEGSRSVRRLHDLHPFDDFAKDRIIAV